MAVVTTPLTETQKATQPAGSFHAWLVCLAAALFFFYEFIQMNMFNAISADLMRAFHVDGTQLGYLSATYLVGDVLLLLPAGIILDRLSVRRVIIAAMLLCIMGTVIFALAGHFYIAAFAHLIAGVGNSFCFLSCVMLASRWFPAKRMALAIGVIVTFAMAGGVVAQTPLTLLAQSVGWRDALLLNALLGVIILTFIFLVVQDYPPNQKNACQEHKQKLAFLGLKNSLILVLSNLQNWLCGIFTGLLNLPIMLLGALWGSLRIMQIHHLSADDASMITSMIFIGTIVGAPILGWISDKIGLRRLPMMVCAILAIVVVCGIIYLPNLTLTDLVILYFLLGFITSSQVISYPVIAESNPKVATGTAMGIASVIIMGSGGVSQPFYGWLLDLGWHKHFVHGVPIYSPEDFYRATLILPIAFLIGLIATFFIKETYCKPFSEQH